DCVSTGTLQEGTASVGGDRQALHSCSLRGGDARKRVFAHKYLVGSYLQSLRCKHKDFRIRFGTIRVFSCDDRLESARQSQVIQHIHRTNTLCRRGYSKGDVRRVQLLEKAGEPGHNGYFSCPLAEELIFARAVFLQTIKSDIA